MVRHILFCSIIKILCGFQSCMQLSKLEKRPRCEENVDLRKCANSRICFVKSTVSHVLLTISNRYWQKLAAMFEIAESTNSCSYQMAHWIQIVSSSDIFSSG